MKVKIEITANGYTKTVKMNDGTKLIEKWKRESHGFGQTDDSIKFEDSGLLEETVEALEGCDFEISAICDALENENSEVIDSDGPAITNDGHSLKRGDVFWSVASMAHGGGVFTSVPLRHKYPKDWGWCGSETYYSREKCQEHCDRHNKPKQVTESSNE